MDLTRGIYWNYWSYLYSLVTEFEDQISTVQSTDGIVGVTKEQELGLERILGKRKQANGLTLLISSKQLDVAMPSDEGH